jgi:ubiquinone biosynthesis protein COQ9
LLPRGEFDLILFWLASRRGLLRGKVEEGGLFRRIAAEKEKDVYELGVEERVRGLLLERLRMNDEVRHVWQDVSISLFFPSFPFLSFPFLFFPII